MNPTLGSREFDLSTIVKIGCVEVYLFFSTYKTNKMVRFAVQSGTQFPISLHKAGFLINQGKKDSFSKHCPITCLGSFVTKPRNTLQANSNRGSDS